MRSNGLRAVLAIAVLLVLALLLWRPSAPAESAVPSFDAADVESASAGALQTVPADSERAPDVESARVGVAAADESGQPLVPGSFLFDVTFETVDSLDRPLSGIAVELAPGRHRANRMGTSASDGTLHLKWRGTEPTIDGVVCATHANRSTLLQGVRLVAGAPISVRLCADRMRTTMKSAAWLLGDATTHPVAAIFVAPAFEIDAAGNGVFTDMDLLVQAEVPPDPATSGRASAFTTRRLGGGARRRVMVAPGVPPALPTIDCIVHDVDGRPVSDVPMRLFKDGSQPAEARSDERGLCSFVDPPKTNVEIEVGGGLFALQRKAFDMTDGGSQRWDVLLPPLPSTRGRLVDAEGMPLRAWRIQARMDEPPFGFQHVCVTDADGKFELGLASSRFARLLVAPVQEEDVPAMRIADHIVSDPNPIELFLRDPQSRVSATWYFDTPVGFLGAAPQARAVRRDSGEGLLLDPCASSVVDGRRRWEFCLEKVLPGRYALTNIAPGGSSMFIASLGTVEDRLGNIPLDGSMQIVFVSEHGDGELWSVRASTRAQGVQVRSEVLTLPGTLLAPAGDLRLDIFTTAEGRAGGFVREVSGKSGERIEIRLDELR